MTDMKNKKRGYVKIKRTGAHFKTIIIRKHNKDQKISFLNFNLLHT